MLRLPKVEEKGGVFENGKIIYFWLLPTPYSLPLSMTWVGVEEQKVINLLMKCCGTNLRQLHLLRHGRYRW